VAFGNRRAVPAQDDRVASRTLLDCCEDGRALGVLADPQPAERLFEREPRLEGRAAGRVSQPLELSGRGQQHRFVEQAIAQRVGGAVARARVEVPADDFGQLSAAVTSGGVVQELAGRRTELGLVRFPHAGWQRADTVGGFALGALKDRTLRTGDFEPRIFGRIEHPLQVMQGLRILLFGDQFAGRIHLLESLAIDGQGRPVGRILIEPSDAAV
jgi:hypothetical protein